MWRHVGKVLTASNLNTPDLSIYQPFTVDKNCILRVVRAWIIQYDNPTWTDFRLRLYSNNFQNKPGALIAESSPRLKSEIFTQDNGAIETYFEFDYPRLRAGVQYHIVPYSPSYSPSGGKHLALRKDWPDPAYPTNNEATKVSAIRQSYAMRFITARL